jgi:hypothetical protein
VGPVIVVHAGNRTDEAGRAPPRFPVDHEAGVAARIGRLLDVLQPEGVVTAAAAGADLLVVEAARQRGIPVHVVLPFDRDRFCTESVEDRGERWTRSYEKAIAGTLADPRSSLIELALEPDADGFRSGNQALLDRAGELAPGRVLALVIRPRLTDEPASVTDDFANAADAAGLFVVEIDPSDPSLGRGGDRSS